MKILQIKFENINNLKGEHSISFDQLPLSTAGIFAIVGPTGAGKSTILDVITLALFNRIPRFKKAISKNEITNEGSVITHHTTEASASIDYEIKGKRYKSSWSVSTNRNGKLRDYEMSFYNPDGSVADLKRSEVPGQNEKIIGLKYDQFIKSILLSQGEFSKFLKADKNERGALLENITGTSIYRNIGIKTYEKYKLVDAQLTKEKEIIGVINTLNEEDRKNYELELKNSKKEKEKLDLVLEAANNLKIIKTDLGQISNSLAQKQKEEIDVINKVTSFRQDQIKLDIHQKLSPVQGPLATYNDAIANAQISQENLKEYELNLAQAKKSHAKTIQDMADLTKSAVDANSFKKIMNDFETEINNADRDLANLKNNGIEARKRVNQKATSYPIPLDKNINPGEAIQLLKQRAQEIQSTINIAKIDTSKPIAEIKKELKQTQSEIDSLKTIELHYKLLDEINLKQETQKLELEKLTELLINKTPLFEKCKKLIESLNQQIELFHKQKEDAIKIAELEELRNSLGSGDACPLCGSKEHPYLEHKPKIHKNEIDQKIATAKQELLKQKTESESLNKELTQCLTSKEHTQKQIDELSKQQANTDNEIKKYILEFNGQSDLEKKNIEHSINTLTKSNQAVEQAIEAVTEAQLNIELTDQYAALQKIIGNYKTLKKNRIEKFEGPDVNDVTNKLQDAFENSKSKITQLTAVIKKETDSLKRDSELVTSIGKDLKPKILELGFSDIKELSNNLLDEASLTKLTNRRDQLTRLKTSVETEVKTLKKELEQKLKLDKKPELSLESIIENISNQSSLREEHNKTFIRNQEILRRDDEDRSKIKAKEKSISSLTKELEKWSLLNKMIGDATGNKFANFAQGLTLQNLLVYANRRLDNLSDRYLLDKPENDGALVIIDKYQGNTSRSVTTLSGGESFLISLALALSLSDMASKNVALESLFIDEGFGTLDPDSLELALNTLEKLQSESQKTVGVISHVEALKERIDVQVNLVKNAQGYSQIEIRNQTG